MTLGGIAGTCWLVSGICSGRKEELGERGPEVLILLRSFPNSINLD